MWRVDHLRMAPTSCWRLCCASATAAAHGARPAWLRRPVAGRCCRLEHRCRRPQSRCVVAPCHLRRRPGRLRGYQLRCRNGAQAKVRQRSLPHVLSAGATQPTMPSASSRHLLGLAPRCPRRRPTTAAAQCWRGTCCASDDQHRWKLVRRRRAQRHGPMSPRGPRLLPCCGKIACFAGCAGVAFTLVAHGSRRLAGAHHMRLKASQFARSTSDTY